MKREKITPEIREALIAARKSLGLSQLDFSLQAEVSLRAISEIESGAQTFSSQILHIIEKGLGLHSLEELVVHAQELRAHPPKESAEKPVIERDAAPSDDGYSAIGFAPELQGIVRESTGHTMEETLVEPAQMEPDKDVKKPYTENDNIKWAGFITSRSSMNSPGKKGGGDQNR